jgi:hypothetical protein
VKVMSGLTSAANTYSHVSGEKEYVMFMNYFVTSSCHVPLLLFAKPCLSQSI